MAKRQVIVELRYNRDLAEAAFSAAPSDTLSLDLAAVPKVQGLSFDQAFVPVPLPGLRARTALDTPYVSGEKFDLALDAKESTYIVRATVDEGQIKDLAEQRQIVGVFADVGIQPTTICPGSGPMGNAADVERLLCVSRLHRQSMDGSGVLVAIVDTGINLAHLAARGKTLTLDVARSWVPRPGLVPGQAPVGHGTMCAFDAAIAAPRATFLDVQLLLSNTQGFSALLSDAVRAYAHLNTVMQAPRRPGEARSLVVNNSWGMFHPSWDFPVGNPGNYSDNPNHPFNRIVAVLEQLGADILFAAGNCGSNCPDGRCQGVTANAIYGANGHPSVLTVGGVDTSKARVGYSTQGPGRLALNKPDLCGYTHFQGSGVYAADGGTSAATPVVAGVVAAVRNKKPFQPGNPSVSPASIRAFMRSTAEDLGSAGFDFDHGFGVVGGCRIADQFESVGKISICVRYPRLCERIPKLCLRYPWLCKGVPNPKFPPGRPPGPADAAGAEDDDLEAEIADLIEAALTTSAEANSASRSDRVPPASDCGCGGKKNE